MREITSTHTVPVSVVIPFYRNADTIRRALDSVFNQTALPAEVIVVDDCSPVEHAAALRTAVDS